MDVFWWQVGLAAVLIFIVLYLWKSSWTRGIQNQYSPHKPVFWKWLGRKSAEQGEQQADALSREALAANRLENIQTETQIADLTREHELTETPAKLERESEIKTLAHEQALAAAGNVIAVTNEATDGKETVTGYEQRKLKEAEIDVAIRLDTAKTNNEIEKHRQTKDIDFEIWKLEKEIEVKGAIIATIAEQYQLEALTEFHTRMLDRKELLLLEPENETRQKKLRRINKNIKLLDEAIDAKGQILIQGNHRRKLGPVDED